MAPKPKYIPVKEAQAITGRKSATALRQFIQKWNYANLDTPIMCIPGYVEEHSLLRALDKKAQKYTPGIEVRRAVASGRSHRR